MSNPYITIKYNKLRDRLREKVKMSATEIEGFVVGLSGTDSILTYMLLTELANDEALKKANRQFKVHGIHYVDSLAVPDTFQKVTEPFLSNFGGKIDIFELPNNVDQFRWADLHYRAVNRPMRGPRRDIHERFWVASTVNATEKALGTYSIMAKSASIEPIASLYKSEVLDICHELGVPEQLIKNSQIPDCACGREEFASENIELIDALIRNVIPEAYSIEKVREAMKYIADTKKEFGFKQRTPYSV